jgi:hypothetical protein
MKNVRLQARQETPKAKNEVVEIVEVAASND